MKQDPCFKYLAAAILVGVILAITEPANANDQRTTQPDSPAVLTAGPDH
jgi:hypothetical protein